MCMLLANDSLFKDIATLSHMKMKMIQDAN